MPILATLVTVQVADSYLGWGKIKSYVNSLQENTIPSPLINPFWKIDDNKYKMLKGFALVHSQMQPDWGGVLYVQRRFWFSYGYCLLS